MLNSLFPYLLAALVVAGPLLMGISYARRLYRAGRMSAGTEAETGGNSLEADFPQFFLPEGATRVKDLAPGETVHCSTRSGATYAFTLIDPASAAFSLVRKKRVGGERRYPLVTFVASIGQDGTLYFQAFVPNTSLKFENPANPPDKRENVTSPVVRIMRDDPRKN